MKLRSSSSGAQSGTPDTGGRRRVRTIAVGALPVVVIVALLGMTSIPGTDINLTVPFAAEGEGPTFNTLGDVDGTPVVDITGVDDDELDETSGNLNMTTGSSNGKQLTISLTKSSPESYTTSLKKVPPLISAQSAL